jgi:CheY-like chemotaxis protein
VSTRILLVEDEEPLTLLIRYNLEAEGYEVDAVARGDDADLRLREADARPRSPRLDGCRACPASSSAGRIRARARRSGCRSSC